MTLGFSEVTPAPLAGVTDLKTDLWQKKFTFKSGTRYNVTAPSGKGKTTFVHCLYGLRFDYSGQVMIDSVSASNITIHQWSALRKDSLSIVFQDLRLFLHLTALENILVKSALYSEDTNDRISRMAEELQISHILNKKGNQLSYGERQRVAILRAMLQPFQWLLLDEPFSHLDEENAQRAAALIDQEVTVRGAGMIVTSLGEDMHFNFDERVRL